MVSPHDLLPAPEPCTVDPPPGYFYENVAKPLLKDTIRIMLNGIPIDLDKVRELEDVVTEVLERVDTTLANNQYMQQFMLLMYSNDKRNYIHEKQSKMRNYKYYLKPFKHNDMTHRSYFMQEFIKNKTVLIPSETLPTGVPKWTKKDVTQLLPSYPALARLLEGFYTEGNNAFVRTAMRALATDRAAIYNQSYLNAIKNVDNIPPPQFSPASSPQMKQLFDWLGLESEETSKKTGEPSWSRAQIERIHKETTDPVIKDITQALIDHSTSAIIKSNFIKAFYTYSIEGRLYGSLKLFGAKTFRLTSNNPQMGLCRSNPTSKIP